MDTHGPERREGTGLGLSPSLSQDTSLTRGERTTLNLPLAESTAGTTSLLSGHADLPIPDGVVQPQLESMAVPAPTAGFSFSFAELDLLIDQEEAVIEHLERLDARDFVPAMYACADETDDEAMEDIALPPPAHDPSEADATGETNAEQLLKNFKPEESTHFQILRNILIAANNKSYFSTTKSALLGGTSGEVDPTDLEAKQAALVDSLGTDSALSHLKQTLFSLSRGEHLVPKSPEQLEQQAKEEGTTDLRGEETDVLPALQTEDGGVEASEDPMMPSDAVTDEDDDDNDSISTDSDLSEMDDMSRALHELSREAARARGLHRKAAEALIEGVRSSQIQRQQRLQAELEGKRASITESPRGKIPKMTWQNALMHLSPRHKSMSYGRAESPSAGVLDSTNLSPHAYQRWYDLSATTDLRTPTTRVKRPSPVSSSSGAGPTRAEVREQAWSPSAEIAAMLERTRSKQRGEAPGASQYPPQKSSQLSLEELAREAEDGILPLITLQKSFGSVYQPYPGIDGGETPEPTPRFARSGLRPHQLVLPRSTSPGSSSNTSIASESPRNEEALFAQELDVPQVSPVTGARKVLHPRPLRLARQQRRPSLTSDGDAEDVTRSDDELSQGLGGNDPEVSEFGDQPTPMAGQSSPFSPSASAAPLPTAHTSQHLPLLLTLSASLGSGVPEPTNWQSLLKVSTVAATATGVSNYGQRPAFLARSPEKGEEGEQASQDSASPMRLSSPTPPSLASPMSISSSIAGQDSTIASLAMLQSKDVGVSAEHFRLAHIECSEELVANVAACALGIDSKTLQTDLERVHESLAQQQQQQQPKAPGDMSNPSATNSVTSASDVKTYVPLSQKILTPPSSTFPAPLAPTVSPLQDYSADGSTMATMAVPQTTRSPLGPACVSKAVRGHRRRRSDPDTLPLRLSHVFPAALEPRSTRSPMQREILASVICMDSPEDYRRATAIEAGAAAASSIPAFAHAFSDASREALHSTHYPATPFIGASLGFVKTPEVVRAMAALVHGYLCPLRGDAIYRLGDRAEGCFYVVLSGSVEIVDTQLNTTRLGPGAVFGTEGLAAAMETVVSAEECAADLASVLNVPGARSTTLGELTGGRPADTSDPNSIGTNDQTEKNEHGSVIASLLPDDITRNYANSPAIWWPPAKRLANEGTPTESPGSYHPLQGTSALFSPTDPLTKAKAKSVGLAAHGSDLPEIPGPSAIAPSGAIPVDYLAVLKGANGESMLPSTVYEEELKEIAVLTGATPKPKATSPPSSPVSSASRVPEASSRALLGAGSVQSFSDLCGVTPKDFIVMASHAETYARTALEIAFHHNDHSPRSEGSASMKQFENALSTEYRKPTPMQLRLLEQMRALPPTPLGISVSQADLSSGDETLTASVPLDAVGQHLAFLRRHRLDRIPRMSWAVSQEDYTLIGVISTWEFAAYQRAWMKGDLAGLAERLGISGLCHTSDPLIALATEGPSLFNSSAAVAARQAASNANEADMNSLSALPSIFGGHSERSARTTMSGSRSMSDKDQMLSNVVKAAVAEVTTATADGASTQVTASALFQPSARPVLRPKDVFFAALRQNPKSLVEELTSADGNASTTLLNQHLQRVTRARLQGQVGSKLIDAPLDMWKSDLLERLIQAGMLTCHRQGSVLATQGESSAFIHIVISGTVTSHVEDDSANVVISCSGPQHSSAPERAHESKGSGLQPGTDQSFILSTVKSMHRVETEAIISRAVAINEFGRLRDEAEVARAMYEHEWKRTLESGKASTRPNLGTAGANASGQSPRTKAYRKLYGETQARNSPASVLPTVAPLDSDVVLGPFHLPYAACGYPATPSHPTQSSATKDDTSEAGNSELVQHVEECFRRGLENATIPVVPPLSSSSHAPGLTWLMARALAKNPVDVAEVAIRNALEKEQASSPNQTGSPASSHSRLQSPSTEDPRVGDESGGSPFSIMVTSPDEHELGQVQTNRTKQLRPGHRRFFSHNRAQDLVADPDAFLSDQSGAQNQNSSSLMRRESEQLRALSTAFQSDDVIERNADTPALQVTELYPHSPGGTPRSHMSRDPRMNQTFGSLSGVSVLKPRDYQKRLRRLERELVRQQLHSLSLMKDVFDQVMLGGILTRWQEAFNQLRAIGPDTQASASGLQSKLVHRSVLRIAEGLSPAERLELVSTMRQAAKAATRRWLWKVFALQDPRSGLEVEPHTLARRVLGMPSLADVVQHAQTQMSGNDDHTISQSQIDKFAQDSVKMKMTFMTHCVWFETLELLRSTFTVHHTRHHILHASRHADALLPSELRLRHHRIPVVKDSQQESGRTQQEFTPKTTGAPSLGISQSPQGNGPLNLVVDHALTAAYRRQFPRGTVTAEHGTGAVLGDAEYVDSPVATWVALARQRSSAILNELFVAATTSNSLESHRYGSFKAGHTPRQQSRTLGSHSGRGSSLGSNPASPFAKVQALTASLTHNDSTPYHLRAEELNPTLTSPAVSLLPVWQGAFASVPSLATQVVSSPTALILTVPAHAYFRLLMEHKYQTETSSADEVSEWARVPQAWRENAALRRAMFYRLPGQRSEAEIHLLDQTFGRSLELCPSSGKLFASELVRKAYFSQMVAHQLQRGTLIAKPAPYLSQPLLAAILIDRGRLSMREAEAVASRTGLGLSLGMLTPYGNGSLQLGPTSRSLLMHRVAAQLAKVATGEGVNSSHLQAASLATSVLMLESLLNSPESPSYQNSSDSEATPKAEDVRHASSMSGKSTVFTFAAPTGFPSSSNTAATALTLALSHPLHDATHIPPSGSALCFAVDYVHKLRQAVAVAQGTLLQNTNWLHQTFDAKRKLNHTDQKGPFETAVAEFLAKFSRRSQAVPNLSLQPRPNQASMAKTTMKSANIVSDRNSDTKSEALPRHVQVVLNSLTQLLGQDQRASLRRSCHTFPHYTLSSSPSLAIWANYQWLAANRDRTTSATAGIAALWASTLAASGGIANLTRVVHQRLRLHMAAVRTSSSTGSSRIPSTSPKKWTLPVYRVPKPVLRSDFKLNSPREWDSQPPMAFGAEDEDNHALTTPFNTEARDEGAGRAAAPAPNNQSDAISSSHEQRASQIVPADPPPGSSSLQLPRTPDVMYQNGERTPDWLRSMSPEPHGMTELLELFSPQGLDPAYGTTYEHFDAYQCPPLEVLGSELVLPDDPELVVMERLRHQRTRQGRGKSRSSKHYGTTLHTASVLRTGGGFDPAPPNLDSVPELEQEEQLRYGLEGFHSSQHYSSAALKRLQLPRALRPRARVSVSLESPRHSIIDVGRLFRFLVVRPTPAEQPLSYFLDAAAVAASSAYGPMSRAQASMTANPGFHSVAPGLETSSGSCGDTWSMHDTSHEPLRKTKPTHLKISTEPERGEVSKKNWGDGASHDRPHVMLQMLSLAPKWPKVSTNYPGFLTTEDEFSKEFDYQPDKIQKSEHESDHDSPSWIDLLFMTTNQTRHSTPRSRVLSPLLQSLATPLCLQPALQQPRGRTIRLGRHTYQSITPALLVYAAGVADGNQISPLLASLVSTYATVSTRSHSPSSQRGVMVKGSSPYQPERPYVEELCSAPDPGAHVLVASGALCSFLATASNQYLRRFKLANDVGTDDLSRDKGVGDTMQLLRDLLQPDSLSPPRMANVTGDDAADPFRTSGLASVSNKPTFYALGGTNSDVTTDLGQGIASAYTLGTSSPKSASIEPPAWATAVQDFTILGRGMQLSPPKFGHDLLMAHMEDLAYAATATAAKHLANAASNTFDHADPPTQKPTGEHTRRRSFAESVMVATQMSDFAQRQRRWLADTLARSYLNLYEDFARNAELSASLSAKVSLCYSPQAIIFTMPTPEAYWAVFAPLELAKTTFLQTMCYPLSEMFKPLLPQTSKGQALAIVGGEDAKGGDDTKSEHASGTLESQPVALGDSISIPREAETCAIESPLANLMDHLPTATSHAVARCTSLEGLGRAGISLAEGLRFLVREAQWRTFPKANTILVAEGSRSQELYFLFKGACLVEKTLYMGFSRPESSGEAGQTQGGHGSNEVLPLPARITLRRVPLTVMQRGALVNILSGLLNAASPVTISTATADTELLVLPRAALLRVISKKFYRQLLDTAKSTARWYQQRVQRLLQRLDPLTILAAAASRARVGATPEQWLSLLRGTKVALGELPSSFDSKVTKSTQQVGSLRERNSELAERVKVLQSLALSLDIRQLLSRTSALSQHAQTPNQDLARSPLASHIVQAVVGTTATTAHVMAGISSDDKLQDIIAMLESQDLRSATTGTQSTRTTSSQPKSEQPKRQPLYISNSDRRKTIRATATQLAQLLQLARSATTLSKTSITTATRSDRQPQTVSRALSTAGASYVSQQGQRRPVCRMRAVAEIIAALRNQAPPPAKALLHVPPHLRSGPGRITARAGIPAAGGLFTRQGFISSALRMPLPPPWFAYTVLGAPIVEQAAEAALLAFAGEIAGNDLLGARTESNQMGDTGPLDNIGRAGQGSPQTNTLSAAGAHGTKATLGLGASGHTIHNLAPKPFVDEAQQQIARNKLYEKLHTVDQRLLEAVEKIALEAARTREAHDLHSRFYPQVDLTGLHEAVARQTKQRENMLFMESIGTRKMDSTSLSYDTGHSLVPAGADAMGTPGPSISQASSGDLQTFNRSIMTASSPTPLRDDLWSRADRAAQVYLDQIGFRSWNQQSDPKSFVHFVSNELHLLPSVADRILELCKSDSDAPATELINYYLASRANHIRQSPSDLGVGALDAISIGFLQDIFAERMAQEGGSRLQDLTKSGLNVSPPSNVQQPSSEYGSREPKVESAAVNLDDTKIGATLRVLLRTSPATALAFATAVGRGAAGFTSFGKSALGIALKSLSTQDAHGAIAPTPSSILRGNTSLLCSYGPSVVKGTLSVLPNLSQEGIHAPRSDDKGSVVLATRPTLIPRSTLPLWAVIPQFLGQDVIQTYEVLRPFTQSNALTEVLSVQRGHSSEELNLERKFRSILPRSGVEPVPEAVNSTTAGEEQDEKTSSYTIYGDPKRHQPRLLIPPVFPNDSSVETHNLQQSTFSNIRAFYQYSTFDLATGAFLERCLQVTAEERRRIMEDLLRRGNAGGKRVLTGATLLNEITIGLADAASSGLLAELNARLALTQISTSAEVVEGATMQLRASTARPRHKNQRLRRKRELSKAALRGLISLLEAAMASESRNEISRDQLKSIVAELGLDLLKPDGTISQTQKKGRSFTHRRLGEELQGLLVSRRRPTRYGSPVVSPKKHLLSSSSAVATRANPDSASTDLTPQRTVFGPSGEVDAIALHTASLLGKSWVMSKQIPNLIVHQFVPRRQVPIVDQSNAAGRPPPISPRELAMTIRALPQPSAKVMLAGSHRAVVRDMQALRKGSVQPHIGTSVSETHMSLSDLRHIDSEAEAAQLWRALLNVSIAIARPAIEQSDFEPHSLFTARFNTVAKSQEQIKQALKEASADTDDDPDSRLLEVTSSLDASGARKGLSFAQLQPNITKPLPKSVADLVDISRTRYSTVASRVYEAKGAAQLRADAENARRLARLVRLRQAEARRQALKLLGVDVEDPLSAFIDVYKLKEAWKELSSSDPRSEQQGDSTPSASHTQQLIGFATPTQLPDVSLLHVEVPRSLDDPLLSNVPLGPKTERKYGIHNGSPRFPTGVAEKHAFDRAELRSGLRGSFFSSVNDAHPTGEGSMASDARDALDAAPTSQALSRLSILGSSRVPSKTGDDVQKGDLEVVDEMLRRTLNRRLSYVALSLLHNKAGLPFDYVPSTGGQRIASRTEHARKGLRLGSMVADIVHPSEQRLIHPDGFSKSREESRMSCIVLPTEKLQRDSVPELTDQSPIPTKVDSGGATPRENRPARPQPDTDDTVESTAKQALLVLQVTNELIELYSAFRGQLEMREKMVRSASSTKVSLSGLNNETEIASLGAEGAAEFVGQWIKGRVRGMMDGRDDARIQEAVSLLTNLVRSDSPVYLLALERLRRRVEDERTALLAQELMHGSLTSGVSLQEHDADLTPMEAAARQKELAAEHDEAIITQVVAKIERSLKDSETSREELVLKARAEATRPSTVPDTSSSSTYSAIGKWLAPTSMSYREHNEQHDIAINALEQLSRGTEVYHGLIEAEFGHALRDRAKEEFLALARMRTDLFGVGSDGKPLVVQNESPAQVLAREAWVRSKQLSDMFDRQLNQSKHSDADHLGTSETPENSSSLDQTTDGPDIWHWYDGELEEETPHGDVADEERRKREEREYADAQGDSTTLQRKVPPLPFHGIYTLDKRKVERDLKGPDDDGVNGVLQGGEELPVDPVEDDLSCFDAELNIHEAAVMQESIEQVTARRTTTLGLRDLLRLCDSYSLEWKRINRDLQKLSSPGVNSVGDKSSTSDSPSQDDVALPGQTLQDKLEQLQLMKTNLKWRRRLLAVRLGRLRILAAVRRGWRRRQNEALEQLWTEMLEAADKAEQAPGAFRITSKDTLQAFTFRGTGVMQRPRLFEGTRAERLAKMKVLNIWMHERAIDSAKDSTSTAGPSSTNSPSQTSGVPSSGSHGPERYQTRPRPAQSTSKRFKLPRTHHRVLELLFPSQAGLLRLNSLVSSQETAMVSMRRAPSLTNYGENQLPAMQSMDSSVVNDAPRPRQNRRSLPLDTIRPNRPVADDSNDGPIPASKVLEIARQASITAERIANIRASGGHDSVEGISVTQGLNRMGSSDWKGALPQVGGSLATLSTQSTRSTEDAHSSHRSTLPTASPGFGRSSSTLTEGHPTLQRLSSYTRQGTLTSASQGAGSTADPQTLEYERQRSLRALTYQRERQIQQALQEKERQDDLAMNFYLFAQAVEAKRISLYRAQESTPISRAVFTTNDEPYSAKTTSSDSGSPEVTTTTPVVDAASSARNPLDLEAMRREVNQRLQMVMSDQTLPPVTWRHRPLASLSGGSNRHTQATYLSGVPQSRGAGTSSNNSQSQTSLGRLGATLAGLGTSHVSSSLGQQPGQARPATSRSKRYTAPLSVILGSASGGSESGDDTPRRKVRGPYQPSDL